MKTMNAIALAILLAACSRPNQDQQNSTITKNDSTTTVKSYASTNLFTDIDDTREKLSTVGIGQLSDWKDDQMGGFISLTSYYTFGANNLNNLAYYLEGVNSDQISAIKLVLNINNKSETKQALQILAETTEKTFAALNLTKPTALMESIAKENPTMIDGDKFATELKLEKSKINTWMVIITAKP